MMMPLSPCWCCAMRCPVLTSYVSHRKLLGLTLSFLVPGRLLTALGADVRVGVCVHAAMHARWARWLGPARSMHSMSSAAQAHVRCGRRPGPHSGVGLRAPPHPKAFVRAAVSQWKLAASGERSRWTSSASADLDSACIGATAVARALQGWVVRVFGLPLDGRPWRAGVGRDDREAAGRSRVPGERRVHDA